MSTTLITGGAGFIGSHFVEMAVRRGLKVVVIDALTYAGNLRNLESVKSEIEFVEGSIGNRQLILELFKKFKFTSVINFAAESHVDRSIDSATKFVDSNVMGAFVVLDAAHRHWEKLEGAKKTEFRFVQVSTDEVFGSLEETGYFSEVSPYKPSSPYSASKAAADHLVRAWFHTYGVPSIITNCSNNYGPRQFPEKLIPFMIGRALLNKKMPVYGTGKNVRDWIHVEDHCEGIWLALTKGKPGGTYCFGGKAERRNLDVVEQICQQLDVQQPLKDKKYKSLVEFVEDRKGHDWRYSIDDALAVRELGFNRKYTFEVGIAKTVDWYLKNRNWLDESISKVKHIF